jgi:ABC-type polysaccharide/polyol phosphate transport system ATPase subunit
MLSSASANHDSEAPVTEPKPKIPTLIEPSPAPAVIEARGLSKRFDIYLNDRSRFFEFFGRRRHHEEHWALRDVSFQVERGRSFGVVGPNGAGKSTLLKLIAGISAPSSGELRINASMSTLLDLGLGFHPNFTGRENIALNCSLLGLTREEADERIPEIIAFAELDSFIDYPVRTYSTGMMLRLGFAIAGHTDADIFLVDEVLAVGDQYFQRKCIRKIEEFVEMGRTIVLVSHDLHAVRSLCHHALWLDGGRVQAVGTSREIVERYMGLERVRISQLRPTPEGSPLPRLEEAPPPRQVPSAYTASVDDPELQRVLLDVCAMPDAERIWREGGGTEAYERYDGDKPVVVGSGEVRVLEVRLLDGLGRPRRRMRTGEKLVVAVSFRTTEPVERPIFGVAIFRDDGVYVFGPNTRFDGVLDGTYNGVYTFFIVYPSLDLLAGRYRFSIAAFDKSHLKPHVWHNQLYDLEVVQDCEDHGLVQLDHGWGLITHHEPSPAGAEDHE